MTDTTISSSEGGGKPGAPMSSEPVQRRLAAILAADVVGYSRLMAADEEGTLARLRDLRADFIDPTIGKHRGRIVKLMGDGTLVEFASVVDAVRCAVDIQRGMAERDPDLPDDQRIRFRIGVNLGDVIIEGDDIYGGGVNIAARLEALADPGGILISGTAHDHVEGRLDCAFEFVGERQVKNIERPVRVYRVHLAPEQAGLKTSSGNKARRRWVLPTAAAVLLLIAIPLVVWLKPWSSNFEPASIERMEFPMPDKPSIAVLPFATPGSDSRDRMISDGITNDIITDLSKYRDFVLIAGHSTSTYKDRPVTVQQVAEELGVQYVLEGSMQTFGDQVRVHVKFVDAIAGEYLWTERFDRDTTDIFAVQDEITQKVVTAIATLDGRLADTNLARAKLKKPINLNAYELVQLAREKRHQFDKESLRTSLQLLQQALKIDPNFARAHVDSAWGYLHAVWNGYAQSPDLSSKNALSHAEKAVEIDDSFAEAHWVLGSAQQVNGMDEEAIASMKRALQLNPNNADLLADWGGFWLPCMLGERQDGIAFIETAMRLNPFYPNWYGHLRIFALFFSRRYDDVIVAFRTAEAPTLHVRQMLAAAYGYTGNTKGAEESVAKLLEIHPDFTLQSITNADFGIDACVEDVREGLRRAGVRGN